MFLNFCKYRYRGFPTIAIVAWGIFSGVEARSRPDVKLLRRLRVDFVDSGRITEELSVDPVRQVRMDCFDLVDSGRLKEEFSLGGCFERTCCKFTGRE